MRGKSAWALAAAMTLPFCVGCTNGGAVVRGQNPGIPAAAVEQPGHPVGFHHAAEYELNKFANENCNWLHGPINTPTGPGCGPGCGPNGCGANGCGADGCGLCREPNYNAGWYPTHHQWYTYHQPGVGLHGGGPLLYPPANAPGAVVVYPYYTVKGPDDFFWPPLAKTR